jgi:hypothetical protein
LSHLVILGDEVESVLTAVSAAQALGRFSRHRVTLIRRSTGLLGGLSTRGGLAYMDLTPGMFSPLFAEFLRRAKVKRVALDPVRGHRALEAMLKRAGVHVISGVEVTPQRNPDGSFTLFNPDQNPLINVDILIDTTPDADYARALGVPFTVGFEHQFGEDRNFLGISPVFRLTDVTPQALIQAEIRLRQRDDLKPLLDAAFPHHPDSERAAWVSRNPFLGPDYIDILNPAIGVIFHDWRVRTLGLKAPYPEADQWIDGANIAILPDGSLSWNGLVTRCNDVNQLLAYSQEREPIPEGLLEAMRQFETFLRTEGGLPTVGVIPPEVLYVRQTVNVKTRHPLTLDSLLAGGVPEHESIGRYSYWIDTRGLNLWQIAPEKMPLQKPNFNSTLEACLFTSTEYQNLAVVSRSAGFSGLAQGACRIVQHLSLLGEAVGIAAALAVKSECPLNQIPVSLVYKHLWQHLVKPISPWLG